MPIPRPDDVTPFAPEAPSYAGRIGESVANAPSNILNDLMRLSYNVGFRNPDQEKAYEVPVPYQIPEAQDAGEIGIDVVSKIGESLPLFLSGEGAGAGMAKLAGAGPMLSRMMKVGTGFGVSGLSQSPEAGAVGAALGGGMGAVEQMLPGPARYAAAAGLGAGTYADVKHQGGSNTRATVMALANAILPLLGRRQIPVTAAAEAVEAAEPQLALPAGRAPLQLEDVQTARPIYGMPRSSPSAPGEAGFTVGAETQTPFGGRLGAGQPRLPGAGVALSRPYWHDKPQFAGDFEIMRTPEGRVIRPAAPAPTIDVEAEVLPPLLHDAPPPPMPQSEANARPPVEPIAPRAPTAPRAPRAPNAPRTPIAPVLPLAPSPSIPPVPAEPPPKMVKVATLQQGKIKGPALVDESGYVIAEGKYGDDHQSLLAAAMGTPQEEAVLRAFQNDNQHVFRLENGKITNRKIGAKIAVKQGQAPAGTTELHSADLIAVDAAADNARLKGERDGIAQPKDNALVPAAAAAPAPAPLDTPVAPPKNVSLLKLKNAAKKMGLTVEDDKGNATLHIHAPPGHAWEGGALRSLAHPYGSKGSFKPEWRQEAINEAHARIHDMGPPENVATPQQLKAEALDNEIQDWVTNDDKKKVLSTIKKAHKAGLVSDSVLAEAQRISKDRDMGAADVADSGAQDELRAHYETKTVGSEAAKLDELVSNLGKSKAAGSTGTEVATLQPPLINTTEKVWYRGSKTGELKDANEYWLTGNPDYARGFGSRVDRYNVQQPKSIGIWNPQETPAKNWARLKREGHDAAVHEMDYDSLVLSNESARLADKIPPLVTPPLPLETPSTIDLPHGLKPGEKAFITLHGEDRILATIQGQGEAGMIRVSTKNYGEVNVPKEDIAPLQLTNRQRVERAPRKGDIVSSGLTRDYATENPDRLPGSGGKMKRSRFGEHGSIDPEVASIVSRYVVLPVIGGAVGYAEDEQHRVSSALMGALIGGTVGFGMGKLLRVFQDIHPPGSLKGGKLPAALKDDLWSATKALFANEAMAAKAASRWGTANAYDHLARWMQKYATALPAAVRYMDKAHGLIETVADPMVKSLRSLAAHPAALAYQADIDAYFGGRMTFATLQARVSAHPEIASLAAMATKGRDTLQGIIVQGLGGGKLASKIAESMKLHNYMTTTYKVFRDKRYYPTDLEVERAAQSVAKMFPLENLATRIDKIHEYLREAKMNTAMGKGTHFEGGESMGAVLGRYDKAMTPEFKAMLGEYKDPLIKMGFTASKLINAARAAEFFNEIAGGVKANGLRYAYTSAERQSAIATLQHQLTHGRLTMEERAAVDAKLKDLRQYIPNGHGTAHGRLSGQWIDVRMRDQLANFDTAATMFSSPMGKGLALTAGAIRYGKVVLSPLQLTRQIMQIPILGLMAHTFPTDWIQAYKALKDPVQRARLTRLGVTAGDSIEGMVRKDMRAMLDGSLGTIIHGRIGNALHKWEELWRTPDLIVRASSFMRKEKQLLALGKSADEAANAAIDHMNRYTMNYGAVPPWVMMGRQIPFVNQYLSWTTETIRITKNLVEDAKGGDAYAMGVLATMAAAPAILQQMTESALSDKDRKEWDRVKNMGPTYSRYNFKFVMGREPNGHFRYLDFTPLVVHDQVMRMVRAGMAGDTEGVRSANPIVGWEDTPLLNVASVLVTGRDRLTGQKLDDATSQFDVLRREMAPPLLGTDFDRIKLALTPNDKGGLGVMNTKTGTSNSIGDVLLTYAISMRPYTVNPAYVEKQAIAETRDRIRSQMITYNRIKNSNASLAQKAAARQNYLTARDHILRAFQGKLGVEKVNPQSVEP